MGKTFPARLHVLLAREAPVGLVIRRGPSKTTCTIGWDRQTDEFAVGQWVRARIYERRCDLSPDGRHFIYFAMKGGKPYTAISRAPYLKAVVFYPWTSTWDGGGLWTSNQAYWLYGGGQTAKVTEDSGSVRQDRGHAPAIPQGTECLPIYFTRLQRDGWTQTACRRRSLACLWDRSARRAAFERAAPGGWVLRKLVHASINPPAGAGVYWDTHELHHPATGAVIACPDWSWADMDGERLVWAAHGQLWTSELEESGLREQRLLHDFNDMTFEGIKAPYDA